MLPTWHNTLVVYMWPYMHAFHKFMYLFACFATCWTKVIRPYKLLHGGCNLLILFPVAVVMNWLWTCCKSELLWFLQTMMLNDRIRSLSALQGALRKAEEHLSSLPADTPYSDFHHRYWIYFAWTQFIFTYKYTTTKIMY